MRILFASAVVVLAEDKAIQEKLAYYDLKVQTFEEASPIQIYPARVLSHIFAHLGTCGRFTADALVQRKDGVHNLLGWELNFALNACEHSEQILTGLLYLAGRNSKLGLSGRPSDVVGILATSKLYTLGKKTMAFLPQVRSSVVTSVPSF